MELLPYKQARKFVQKLKLTSHKEWLAYCKSGAKPANVPYHPQVKYHRAGWVSWYDWLGIEERDYLHFEEARDFARSLKLKSSAEWYAYCKRGKPSMIPANPRIEYLNDGWVSFYDWLGTKEPNRDFLPYDEAQALVHLLGIGSQRAWNAYCTSGKKPDNLPSAPAVYYKHKGWQGFAAWLGIEVAAKEKVAQ